MTTPKRRIVAALALTAVAAGAVYWFMQRPDPALHHPDHDAPIDIATTDATPREGAPESAPTSPPRQRHGVVRMGDPVHSPKTEAEVAWLNRHLFPSADEAQRGAASATMRDPLPRGGPYTPADLIRASALGALDPTRRDEAVAYLSGAAVDGSIYALEELGRFHSIGPKRDPVTSEAYFRASMLRGNWPVTMRMRPRLANVQDQMADMLAAQIIVNLNRERRRRNLPPLGYDPRPGLDDTVRWMMMVERNAPGR